MSTVVAKNIEVQNSAGTASANISFDGTKLVSTALESSVKTALNASGSAPIYACRAWVNFNGIGTVAIHASGNVSSITDNGSGDYTVNFTTAMPDESFSWSGSVGGNIPASDQSFRGLWESFRNITGIRVRCQATNPLSSNAEDHIHTCIAIFR